MEGSGLKAVLFDLDGVLIDTEKIYRKLWPKACAECGYELTDDMYLSLRSLGRPFVRERFKQWFGEGCSYDEIRAVRMKLFADYVETYGIDLKPGAKEILEYLKSQGILCSTATATAEDRTRDYLTRTGLLSYFDKICCATHVKEGKPSPELYRYALDTLGLSADECIAVEDAPNGIKSAHGAGLRVMFVPDLTDDEPEIEGLYYKKFASLDELKKFIVYI